jgi:hypothetical protein
LALGGRRGRFVADPEIEKMKRKSEINVPAFFEPDPEIQKLRSAVEAFNNRIQPEVKSPPAIREIARDLIAFRASQKPITYGLHSF